MCTILAIDLRSKSYSLLLLPCSRQPLQQSVAFATVLMIFDKLQCLGPRQGTARPNAIANNHEFHHAAANLFLSTSTQVISAGRRHLLQTNDSEPSFLPVSSEVESSGNYTNSAYKIPVQLFSLNAARPDTVPTAAWALGPKLYDLRVTNLVGILRGDSQIRQSYYSLKGTPEYLHQNSMHLS